MRLGGNGGEVPHSCVRTRISGLYGRKTAVCRGVYSVNYNFPSRCLNYECYYNQCYQSYQFLRPPPWGAGFWILPILSFPLPGLLGSIAWHVQLLQPPIYNQNRLITTPPVQVSRTEKKIERKEFSCKILITGAKIVFWPKESFAVALNGR